MTMTDQGQGLHFFLCFPISSRGQGAEYSRQCILVAKTSTLGFLLIASTEENCHVCNVTSELQDFFFFFERSCRAFWLPRLQHSEGWRKKKQTYRAHVFCDFVLYT
jgi:hypothetical protein